MIPERPERHIAGRGASAPVLLLITRRIRDAGGHKAFVAQPAGFAATAGPPPLVCLVTRDGLREIDAQCRAAANDFRGCSIHLLCALIDGHEEGDDVYQRRRKCE